LQDWSDLWRPELEGKISMVDSPREVVGAVLKYMGASYNTNNLDLQVDGGRTAVQKNLELLEKQVSR
jgi:spermidine/putrescine-binding protein